MNNVAKFLSIFLVLLIVLSVPVFGVGSSTGSQTADTPKTVAPADVQPATIVSNSVDSVADGVQDAASDTVSAASTLRERIQTKKAEIRDRYKDRKCEDISTGKKERIKCRLSKGRDYIAPADTIPEACRRLADNSACQLLYKNVRPCYDKEGRDKARCFKRVAGFTRAKLTDETEGRASKARNYLITLLYDLQERVEDLHEQDKLDSDEATDLVDKIVDIKQSILEGARKAEVKQMMQELRQMWRSAINE